MAGFPPAAVLLLAIGADPAPLLLDPEGALAAAREDARAAPLRAAEADLLAGDADAALADLADAGSTPRRLRLEADAHVALHDHAAAALLEGLARHPGWAQHARRQQATMAAADAQQDSVRLGSLLFALALGLLVLAGARELLVVRIETVVAGIGAAAMMLILAELSKPLMSVGGVLAVAGLALVHAGTAAVRRTAAPPRVRAMVATSMVLGFSGAVWAVFTQISLGGVFALLATA